MVSSPDINAAGSIVGYLLTFAGLNEIEVADGLLTRLAVSRQEESQDRLSYGLWVLICGAVMYEDATRRYWNSSASDSATT